MRVLKLIAITLSALICVAALAAWIWSYLPAHLHITSHNGALVLASVDANDIAWQTYAAGGYTIVDMTQWGDVYQHFLGFAHVSGTNGVVGGFQVIAIPYWFIVLLTAIAPVMFWRQRRSARQRRSVGHCPGCGYDLRGTPDGCPECGWKHNVPPAEPLGSRTA